LGNLGHSGPQPSSAHQAANGNGINSHANGANVNGISAAGSNENGLPRQRNGHPAPPPRRDLRVPPLHGEPTVFLRSELNGHQQQQPAPSTRLGRYSRYLNVGGEGRGGHNNLEKQLLLQQAEICSLREGVKQQADLENRSERELNYKTGILDQKFRLLIRFLESVLQIVGSGSRLTQILIKSSIFPLLLRN